MRNAHLEIDESSYCLFFPQQLSALRPFEKYLRWLPIGGQYFVCAGRSKTEIRLTRILAEHELQRVAQKFLHRPQLLRSHRD